MTIEQLGLAPVMQQRARELQAFCPRVFYISGRRDLQQQAHAMAVNVVTDRHFIFKTYRHAALLQTAVDQNPDAKTVDQLEDVLHATLIIMSTDELDQISDHFSGNAVDLKAMELSGSPTEEGHAVIAWIQQCADTTWVTTREAGKVRWHWSCRASVDV